MNLAVGLWPGLTFRETCKLDTQINMREELADYSENPQFLYLMIHVFYIAVTTKPWAKTPTYQSITPSITRGRPCIFNLR